MDRWKHGAYIAGIAALGTLATCDHCSNTALLEADQIAIAADDMRRDTNNQIRRAYETATSQDGIVSIKNNPAAQAALEKCPSKCEKPINLFPKPGEAGSMSDQFASQIISGTIYRQSERYYRCETARKDCINKTVVPKQ